MKKNGIIMVLLMLLFSDYLTIYAESLYINTYETDIDYTFQSELAELKTDVTELFVNDDGTLTVCALSSNYEDENYLYLYEYDKDKICINTIKIKKIYPEFGSFLRDEFGNYYILYSKDMRAPLVSADKDMVLVKYDSHGVETSRQYFNEFLNNTWNVKRTVFNGSKMKIHGDKLYIYYGRNIIRGNDDIIEKSFVAIFDLSNFTNISKVLPSSIFSRDSDIIITEDGFVALDIYNSFKLSKFSEENYDSIDLLNARYLDQIGGVEKTTKGYIVAGINEKIKNSEVNNVFIQIINEDFSYKQEPIYITDYSDKFEDVISNLKIVQAGYNKYVLLWEVNNKIEDHNDTYMAIVDESGNMIESVKSLGNYSLNSYDDLSYSSEDNKIYYAIKLTNKILINEIDPGAPFIKVSDVKLSEDFIIEEEIIENNFTSNITSNNNIIATSNESFEKRVIELCNYERAKYGLHSLSEDYQLMSLAEIKSQDMANNNYFSHTSPTYGDPFIMMGKFGVSYSYAGENIAMGQRTPEEVVQAWMNSTGHRENILSSNFTKIGVGMVQNQNGQLIWTQEFTKP